MGVQRVIKLARALERAGEGLELGPKEKILSSNTFAGVSINLPIYETCQPTGIRQAVTDLQSDGFYLSDP